MTHKVMPESVRLSVGITDNLVRLSVGLEDPEDLIADISQALRAAVGSYYIFEDYVHSFIHLFNINL